MGWHKGPAENGRCFFLGVMDYNYLVFLYFGTIITPALLLAVFYAHIYHVVLKQLRQIVTINPYNGNSRGQNSSRSTGGGTMLRVLGAAQKREVKATQNLSIIVLFFMICWIPLYTINCILAFCRDCKVNSTFVLSCIILSHLNSAGNPLLYAYHLKDFRAALKAFICNIFGIKLQQPPNSNALNNNFTHYRLQSIREAHSAMSLSQASRFVCESQMRSQTLPHTLPSANKISSLVGNSVALAAATAEASRDIWRISEISDEQQRRSISSIDDDCNDEVFLPSGNRAQALSLTLSLNPSLNVSGTVSPSSPQLYLVEHGVSEHNLPGFTTAPAAEMKPESQGSTGGNLTITGDFIHSPAKSVKLSPFKGLLARPPPRSCSLSEEGEGVRHRNNGYLTENHSCT